MRTSFRFDVYFALIMHLNVNMVNVWFYLALLYAARILELNFGVVKSTKMYLTITSYVHTFFSFCQPISNRFI